MFDKIRELIDYAENALNLGDAVLHRVQEVLNFVKQYFIQEMKVSDVPSPLQASGSNDEFGALRAWCDECEAQGDRMPKGAMPAWLLPILLKLIESVIDRFRREKTNS